MPYLLAFAIGVIAGLRSMTAPAAVSWAVALRGSMLPDLGQSYLAFMQSTITAWIFTVAAAAELVSDKLPFTPSRLSAGPLGARIVMGGLCGATLCLATGQAALVGVVVGAIGAVAGAYAGFLYRTKWTKSLNLPDIVLALVEDAVAVLGAWLIVSQI
jgi:uncharacterized membrane protein